MTAGIVDVGEVLHVITRRNFPDDLRRHFAGQVERVQGSLVRAVGYTFVNNVVAMTWRRRPEVRTRIFNLGDAQHIVNVIHPETDIEALQYLTIDDRLVVTDGRKFRLDINEFGPSF